MDNVRKKVEVVFVFTDDVEGKTIIAHDVNTRNDVRLFFSDNTYCVVASGNNKDTDTEAFIESKVTIG